MQPGTFQGPRLYTIINVYYSTWHQVVAICLHVSKENNKTAGAELNAGMSARCLCRIDHRVKSVLGFLDAAAPSLWWGMNLCLTGVAKLELQC